MNNTTQSHKNDDMSAQKMSPMVAGAVGAVVGVTAAWLSDSTNRQKVSQVVEEAVTRARAGAEDAKKIAADALKEMETQSNDAMEKGKQFAKDKMPEAREAAANAKGEVQKVAKKIDEKKREVS